jgi:7-cyano-7-deazaguanine reductase
MEKKQSQWSQPGILKKIKNPSGSGYEIKIKNPEVTFLGVKNQPDFASVYITLYPKNTIVELKSLKEYFFQFRNKLVSYERLINVIYDDLFEIYDPARLRITMIFNPRGGISSKLTIDSDWSIKGGNEKFKDWFAQEDTW